MKNLIPFLVLLFFYANSCKKEPAEPCVVNDILISDSVSGLSGAGSPFYLYVTTQIDGCTQFTGSFSNRLRIYTLPDSMIVSQITYQVNFNQQEKTVDTLLIQLDEPGDYIFHLCPDIYNEVEEVKEGPCL
jgi:hypothetical protein